MWHDHPSEEVKRAIVQLDDALCVWERNTGRESVLILLEEGGFEHIALSGKPQSNYSTLADLINIIKHKDLEADNGR